MIAIADFERLEDLVAEALAQRPLPNALANDEILGRLARRDQTSPQQLLRAIDRGDLFPVQRSRSVDLVEAAREAETRRNWIAHEHHAEGG